MCLIIGTSMSVHLAPGHDAVDGHRLGRGHESQQPSSLDRPEGILHWGNPFVLTCQVERHRKPGSREKFTDLSFQSVNLEERRSTANKPFELATAELAAVLLLTTRVLQGLVFALSDILTTLLVVETCLVELEVDRLPTVAQKTSFEFASLAGREDMVRAAARGLGKLSSALGAKRYG